MKLYTRLARVLQAYINCVESGNLEWQERHKERIDEILATAPCGSGIDYGTHFDLKGSEPNQLRFLTAYHHMNENGMYDGWTEHSVLVRPDLAFGFSLHISGRDRNGIKEYLSQVYSDWLDSEPTFNY